MVVKIMRYNIFSLRYFKNYDRKLLKKNLKYQIFFKKKKETKND